MSATDTVRPTRLILQPLDAIDPRQTLDDRALVLASQNAFPIVANRQTRKDSAGLVVGGGIALLLGGLTFWSMSGHRAPHGLPAPLPVRPAPMVVTPGPNFAPLATTTPVPRPLLLPSVPSVATAPLAERAPAPVMVFDGSVAPAPAMLPGAVPVGVAVPRAGKSPIAAGGNDNDQFAARVGDSATEVATAQQLSNPATTVTQGTLIPAILETAIDTDLPGYVRAVVSREVRSFDGSRVLIPRSSRLIGQYKSGLTAGQTRAYIIWSRLIRPDGASVALASPTVDFNGTSGLGGKVDSHFMKRFGAAALLTVIGGLSAVGNPSVVLSGGQSAAGVAAQGNVQIPPTIHVAQGQPIRVFTARDLDFSTVSGDGGQP